MVKAKFVLLMVQLLYQVQSFLEFYLCVNYIISFKSFAIYFGYLRNFLLGRFVNVLSWVINKDKVYKTYVQRRLIEIREFISDFEKFIVVPLKLNPADLGTNIYPQKNYLVTNYGLLILNFSVYREIVGHICMLEKKFQIIILIIVV